MTCRSWAVYPACVLLLLFSASGAAGHIDRVFACFVYVEPFEIRVEFVVSTDSMGLSDEVLEGGLDPAEQAQVMPVLQQRMKDAFTLRADDKPVDLRFENVAFVYIHPERGALPDPRKVIPANGSRVSAMFIAERSALPEIVEVELHLYQDERYRPPTRVPVQFEVLTPPGNRTSQQFYLNRGFSVRAWELPADLRFRSAVHEAPVLESPAYTPLYVAGGIVLVGLIVLAVPVASTQTSAKRWGGAGLVLVSVVLAGAGFFRGFAQPIEEAQGRETIQALIENVYFAFAFRDESKVFDTLATSADGPLLESLYLDIRQGLSDANTGGPSVRVLDVEVQECVFSESTTDRLQARVSWHSAGSVSHWGHAHDRRNRYAAEVIAEPIDGRWRLTSVEILEEERID